MREMERGEGREREGERGEEEGGRERGEREMERGGGRARERESPAHTIRTLCPRQSKTLELFSDMKSWNKNEVDSVSHIMSFLKVTKVKTAHTEDMRKHLKSNPGSHSKIASQVGAKIAHTKENVLHARKKNGQLRRVFHEKNLEVHDVRRCFAPRADLCGTQLETHATPPTTPLSLPPLPTRQLSFKLHVREDEIQKIQEFMEDAKMMGRRG